MKLKSGDLRHYIRIDKPVEGTPDQYGRRSVTWTEFARLYAKISDVSGREFYAAAAYQMENVVTFTIRYLSALKVNVRIVYDGSVYEIVEINHLGYRGDFMSIKTKRTGAEASG